LHSRHENVLVASQTTPGAFVQAMTEAVTPKLTFGDDPINEPSLYRGGEQAYYSTADPKQQKADVRRITVTGSGIPGDIIYTGLASVSLSLGSGNDLVTVETTHTGSTSISTGGGNDRVAVRDTHGATSVFTGDGNDTVYVGSEAGLWHTTQVPSVTADANGNKFLNVLGDANEIRAALTVDGGDGTDVVTVDDTKDTASNIGLLTSTQLMGIFGTGGVLEEYSNLESLTVNLGDGGNTFTVASTHGSPTKVATTSISAGAGNDAIYVDTIAGDTTIDSGAGNDSFQVGSTTGPGTPNPVPTSTLNGILNGTLTLTAGSGANQLHAYDSGDSGQNFGK